MAEEAEEAPGVGVFLGSQRTAVALLRDGGRAELIADADGRCWTPSCVAWDAQGNVVVGCSAAERALFNPKNVFFDVHVLLGRAFDDHEVQALAARVPYDIVDIDGKPHVAVTTAQGECQAMSPEQVLALLVARQKQIAEEFLGREVRDVVVTLSMALNDRQREAIKAIGRDAGLNVIRICVGATCACIGLCGSLTVSVDSKEHLLVVVARDGDYATATAINFEEDIYEVIGTKNLDAATLSDAKQSLFEHALQSVDLILEENRKKRQDIEDVYVVGDWDVDTNVFKLILEYTGNPAARVRIEAPDAFEAARGAAMIAHDLTNRTQYTEPLCLLNFFLLSMGVETTGGIQTTVVRRGTTIPGVKSRVFTPLHELQSSVVIKVFEGERVWAANNRCLGQLELHNLRRRSDNRLPQIKVTFDMDYSENLVVFAEEIGTDNKTQFSLSEIERRLPIDRINEIVNIADEHAEEDTVVRNSLSLCASVDEYLSRVTAYASRVTDEYGLVPAFTSNLMGGNPDEDDWIRLEMASANSTLLDDHVRGVADAKLTAATNGTITDMMAMDSCICS